MLIRLLALVSIIFFHNTLLATTHYMSTTGTDSGTCTAIAPCLTLQYAMSQLSSGDVLEISNGTYEDTSSNGNDNYITSTYSPPSGPGTGTGDDRFTIIKATNDLQVTFDMSGSGHGFYDGQSSGSFEYVKFQGIVFKTDSDTYLIDFGQNGCCATTNHIFFKNCGFAKECASGCNSTAAAVWIGSSYMLFEDCFFWGSGRYLLNMYQSADHIVLRRVVFRPDNLDGGGWTTAGLISYNADYVEFQNIIIVDADTDYWINVAYYLGGMYLREPLSEDPTTYNYIRGSIAAYNDFHDAGSGGVNSAFLSHGSTNTNNEFHDCVSIKNIGTGFQDSNNTTAQNCAVYNLDDESGTSRGFNGFDSGITDSITYNNEVGVYGCNDADYVNANSNDTDWSSTSHTNDVSGNPTENGWVYPIRIESGSFLASAGSGSNRVGPNIVKRIGVDGTFYGESGYNTTTEINLWPWPNEDIIRDIMRLYSPGSLNGTRGFCADNMTLTKYIWGALGNTIPGEIYGTSPTISGVTGLGITIQ